MESIYEIAFCGGVAIGVQPLTPSCERSTRKPVSFSELSTQTNLTLVTSDAAVAVRLPGAAGG